jgi:hypothetical protein
MRRFDRQASRTLRSFREINDNRFNEKSQLFDRELFFTYMRDALDVLRREGRAGSPKLLSIGSTIV